MGLFTKRKRPDASAPAFGHGVLLAVADGTLPVGLPDHPVTARRAFAVVLEHVTALAADARLYLVLSADIDDSGSAPFWAFHFLFPTQCAEGVFTIRVATERRGPAPELHYRITPFPAPGSPEHAMAQTGGALMAMLVKEKWEERLGRIVGLPRAFVDSDAAVGALAENGRVLNRHERVRMKGRRLPTGAAVWEFTSPTQQLHVPFG